MTRANTARLAAQIFGGSGTRISVGGRVVAWTSRESDRPHSTLDTSHNNEKGTGPTGHPAAELTELREDG